MFDLAKRFLFIQVSLHVLFTSNLYPVSIMVPKGSQTQYFIEVIFDIRYLEVYCACENPRVIPWMNVQT